MKYLKRNLFEEIKKWMVRREIIAIKGPRQSGKTTLLEMIKEWLIKEKNIEEKNIIFISFEDRELLEGFSVDPKGFVERYIGKDRTYFFIDEAHYCLDLGQKLKLLYDSFKDIKFVITGSSSLELTSQTAKFLVGRVFSFELFPFNFYEFLLARDEKLAGVYFERNRRIREFIFEKKDFKFGRDIFVSELMKLFDEYLMYGGYPEVVKGQNSSEKEIILKNIYNTYIEKDVVSYLQIVDTLKFRKLVSLLSFRIGDVVSYENLVVNCNSYYKDILRLIDVLQQTYVLELLRPFYRNLVTELRKNPKVYFIDSGLRNYSINNFSNIGMREDSGKLAENFVFNEIRNARFSLNFWRTTAKAEVDFILSDMKGVFPVEVKFEKMKREKLGKSFYSFLGAYKPERGLIITKDFWGEIQVGKTKVKFVPIVYL